MINALQRQYLAQCATTAKDSAPPRFLLFFRCLVTIRRISFNSSFARCIELGVDVKVIAQWQGHQDGGKFILSMYSYVRNVHAEEMAKKLV